MASSRGHRRLHRKDRTPPSRAETQRQNELDSLMEGLQALKCSDNNNQVADEIASLLKQKLQLKPRANDDEMFRQMSQVLMSFNLDDTEESLCSSGSSDTDANTTAAHYKENSLLNNGFKTSVSISSPLMDQNSSTSPASTSSSVATDMAKASATRFSRSKSSRRPYQKAFSTMTPPNPERPTATGRSSSVPRTTRAESPWRRKSSCEKSNTSLRDRIFGNRHNNNKVQQTPEQQEQSRSLLAHAPDAQKVEEMRTTTPKLRSKALPMRTFLTTDATPQRSNKKKGPVSVDSPHGVPLDFPTPPSTGNFPTPVANGTTLFSPLYNYNSNDSSPLLTPMEMGQTPLPETMTPTDAPPQPEDAATGVGKQRRKTATPVTTNVASPPIAFSLGAGPKEAEKKRGKIIRAKRVMRNKKMNNHTVQQPQPVQVQPQPATGTPQVQQPQPATVHPQVQQSQTTSVPSMFPETAPTPQPQQPDATSTTRFTAPDLTPQPNTVESPCDMELEGMTPQVSEPPPAVQPSAVIPQFNIGKGDSKKVSPSKRSSPVHMRRRQRLQQRQKNVNAAGLFISSSPPPDVAQAESADTTTDTSEQSDVDYSGAKARVAALKDEARTSYINGDYQESILRYTQALKIYMQHAATAMDDGRAVLLSNRAAALLMVGANDAAALDCQRALEYCSGTSNDGTTEGGPVLKSKLYNRLGRAFLKAARLDEAENAFQLAIATADATLALFQQYSDSYKQSEKYLTQVSAESTLGMTEVRRCRDAMEGIRQCNGHATIPNPIGSADRRNHTQALVHVDMALNHCTGDDALHETRVSLLASLKRWREVIVHCERLAAERVRLDGVFVEDLAPLNPFAGVAPALHLSATQSDTMSLKLSVKAVAEAVLRLPHKVLPIYLRALRLEEKYAHANGGIKAIEEFVNQHNVSELETLRLKYAWLSREQGKVERTMTGKDRGDALFRTGDYLRAATHYAECLTIDAEGVNSNPMGDSTNAGGRVHAVLHCNRAACLMALSKYQEASMECTAALRIHSLYMKAMLRRCRCYARLERYAESVVEYRRWLELVDSAKKAGNAPPSTPCMFDLPSDVTAEDEKKVRQELLEASKAKQKAESSARSAANAQEERQRWYNETFGKDSSSSSRQGDAQRRREQWYNQQGSGNSRRWDSFGGRGPGGGGRSGSFRSKSQGRARYPPQEEQAPPVRSPNANADHYSVLQIRKNASQADVKKAYRKMALKYHPDKNKDDAAADKFRRVTEAYEILSDEALRRKYDTEMRFVRRF